MTSNANGYTYKTLDNVTPVAITSSTNASPIVVTATSHGFETGDQVQITQHEVNTAANGTWEVTKVTDNTFSLTKNLASNTISTGNGVGANTGQCYKAPKVLFAEDFKSVQHAVNTTSSANVKVLFVASNDEEMPDFAQTVSKDNSYDGIQLIESQDGDFVDGNTGIVLSGTDINTIYEQNRNKSRWISVKIEDYTAGTVDIKSTLYSND